MTSTRSAILLTFFGVVALGFFWFTDPTLGIVNRLMDNSTNFIDIANQAWPGTIVGLTGSGVMALTGLWLLTRRWA